MALARAIGRATLSAPRLAGRAREMHRRLEDRLLRAGMGGPDLERVLETHAAALSHRLGVLADEEHFDLLHPSRTMLILLDDCGVTDASVLQAAASIESEFPTLRIAPANAVAHAVPLPGNDALLEALIVASDDVRLVAVAERLDHARHLHLSQRDRWSPFHASAVAIWVPVAHRTHPRLAQRFDRWCAVFGRRFLKAEAGR